MERHVEALEALKTLEKPMITPAEAAPVIGCDPHWIRLMAKSEPEKPGFPVTVVGTRTKIPRIPFIRYMEGTGEV